ncbi:MAG: Uracil-DNA glycosylase superfamily [bacterium]|nr:Uracil-DNA glycosylase superfamily [bacterium]
MSRPRRHTNDTRALAALGERIISCRRCDRLVSWCAEVARDKRAAYAGDVYWGRPVAGFGDPSARLIVVGLAPGAHGANRTGRVFTGDRSGEWLYRALHRAGFANQPTSIARDDGLALSDAWVTVCVRCAPPDNKPTPAERDACLPFLVDELARLRCARVLVCLGRFAWDGVLRALATDARPKFAHAAEVTIGDYTLVGSYHPSQQNTFTGRLTEPMLDAVFARARALVAAA